MHVAISPPPKQTALWQLDVTPQPALLAIFVLLRGLICSICTISNFAYSAALFAMFRITIGDLYGSIVISIDWYWFILIFVMKSAGMTPKINRRTDRQVEQKKQCQKMAINYINIYKYHWTAIISLYDRCLGRGGISTRIHVWINVRFTPLYNFRVV